MSVCLNNPFELETLLISKMSLKFDLSERGIKRAFSAYDRDGDGLLSLREMVDAVQLYLNGVTRQDIKRLMKCYDVNGDGYISCEEFHAMLTSRSATRPKSDRRNRQIKSADNTYSMADMFAAEEESSRARYLQERKKNREVDEAVSILSQARALEQMCAELELELKKKEKQADQEMKYQAACDESLKVRKEAGKPLFPLYAAMGYQEPDLMSAKRNTSFTRGAFDKRGAVDIVYDTDLGGTGKGHKQLYRRGGGH